MAIKLKATKKEIRDGYYYIISIGYCDAQSLLKYENPFAYSAGYYGWACDYYDVNGVCISTGYSPLGASNTIKDYELVREYDLKARDTNGREEVTQLLHELVNKLKKGANT